MKNSFDGARSHPPAPLNPRSDESGPRLIPQREPHQDETRQIDKAALEYINRRKDAQVEVTPTQETTTYSAERLNERLDAYRATRIRGDIDEIKETYALNKNIEPTRKMVRPEGGDLTVRTAVPLPRMSVAETIRREHERARQQREEQAALAAQQEVAEMHRVIEAARPPVNPDLAEKINEIYERRLGKKEKFANRPRLVVTGAPPAPLHLSQLMERAHEEPTEIVDLTEFAEEVEPEIEQTPVERKTNTVIFARNENVPPPPVQPLRPIGRLSPHMTSLEAQDREQGIDYERRARIEAAKQRISELQQTQVKRPDTQLSA